MQPQRQAPAQHRQPQGDSSRRPEGAEQKEGAEAVGKKIGERAMAAGLSKVVFDRGGYLYHGRVKSLAEAAREGGLKF